MHAVEASESKERCSEEISCVSQSLTVEGCKFINLATYEDGAKECCG